MGNDLKEDLASVFSSSPTAEWRCQYRGVSKTKSHAWRRYECNGASVGRHGDRDDYDNVEMKRIKVVLQIK
jgi:hypothetical protein